MVWRRTGSTYTKVGAGLSRSVESCHGRRVTLPAGPTPWWKGMPDSDGSVDLGGNEFGITMLEKAGYCGKADGGRPPACVCDAWLPHSLSASENYSAGPASEYEIVGRASRKSFGWSWIGCDCSVVDRTKQIPPPTLRGSMASIAEPRQAWL